MGKRQKFSCVFLPKLRQGFTLIEVLIFAAVFIVAVAGITVIFITFTNIQAKQGALVEVTQQSQFLLQEIQQYIGAASLVDIPFNTPTSTLKLRMPSSTVDAAYLYLATSTGTFYLQTGASPPQALSSPRVLVSGVSFVRRNNAPGHDSVSVSFTVSYNTSNTKQAFVQSLATAVARVNAATFDSNVVPSVPGGPGGLTLGDSSYQWNSVNNILYFNGANVGIGISNPQQTLEVNGNVQADGWVRLNMAGGSQPACSALYRGILWFTANGGSATDTLQLCVQLNGGGSYTWARVY